MQTKQKSKIHNNFPKRVKQKRPSFKDYKIKEEIGKGSFGQVYLAEQIQTQKLVALKRVKKSRLRRSCRTHSVFYEKLVLTKLKHWSIVKLLQTFQDQDYFYIITEYQSKETLNTFLKRNKFLCQTEVSALAAQLIKTLQYIHQQGFVHRDIKPDNIIIKSNGQIILIDFGSCALFKQINDDQFIKQYDQLKRQFKDFYDFSHQNENFLDGIQGTLQYLSPGQINNQKPHPEADFWALGVLIYKLLVGKFPFDASSHEKVIDNIKKQQVKFPSFISNEAKQIINFLLDKNLQEKVQQKNFYEILKNFDFFKEMDLKYFEQADFQKTEKIIKKNDKIAITCSPEQENIFSRDICYFGQIQQYYWYFYKTKPKLMILERNGTLTIFNQDGSEFQKLKLCKQTMLYSSKLSHLEIRQKKVNLILYLQDLSSLKWIRNIRSLIQFSVQNK